jgi:hypothetical protein
MSKQSRVREALDQFHESSPELAHWLKRLQADKRVDCSRKAA